MKQIVINELIGQRVTFIIGSVTWGGRWDTREEILDKLSETISHNLCNYDYVYNFEYGSEYRKMFKEITLKPIMDNIDKVVNEYFTITDENQICFKTPMSRKEYFLFWIEKYGTTEMKNECKKYEMYMTY